MALRADGRHHLTYEQLASLLSNVGGQLRELGIQRNDRVAMVIPNGPEAATAFLAVSSVATAAPLNPGYRAPEYDFYLADLNARALVVPEHLDSPAVAVAESRGIPVHRLRIDTSAPAGTFSLTAGAADAHGVTFAQPDDIALVLHTSGTTSRPKIVPLRHRHLAASAANIATTLALTPDDCCLNIMPLFHIHGLVAAILASLRAGGSVACSRGFVATEFFDLLASHHPTWYTAVPTMHQAILHRANAHRSAIVHSRLRFIRSSSSSLPPQVAEGLEQTFGVPVIEAYGMTEAAHQMCSNPLPPSERRFGTVGRPAGPDVVIINEAGQHLPPGELGEVAIRGDNVFDGYERNEQANTQAFTHSWFRTGDQGWFDESGHLHLSGRLKELINRGGEKISPREIDEALLGHPQVKQAVAFAVPDDQLGEEIGVAIVPESGTALSEHDVLTFAATKLADFKLPRRIVIVNEIPKGPTGKLRRIGLAKELGVASRFDTSSTAPHSEPATDRERLVAEVWQQVLKLDRVGRTDRFFDLGGDSVLAAGVLAALRERLGNAPDMLIFFESPTVEGMAAAIEAQQHATLSRLIDEIDELDEQQALENLRSGS